jgi:adenine-specific DNA-methyltransferase
MPILDFKGKSFVYAHHLSVPFRELVIDAKKSLPAKGQKPALDDNLIIHGDNLHALKALMPVYAGKVDCIYIDPPYNTGNEGWCYNDNVRSPLMREWLKKSANPVEKEDLERHDKWLCMMWPRLKLLHELLADDGAIFVSIDDNEVHRLRALLDDIFGAENFLVQIIWKKRSTPPNDQIVGANHEYVLVYSRNANNSDLNLRERGEEQLARYKNPDNHPKGQWIPGDLMANVKGGRFVESLYFPIKNPKTGEDHFPGTPASKGNWRFNKDKIARLFASNEISFGEDGLGRPKLKRFLRDVKMGMTYPTIWDFVPFNTTGSEEMSALFGDMKAFDNPKPSGLMTELLKLGTRQDSIVLDSFAGSGTTAHAVLALNKKDGGNRRFILVETEDYAYTLTAERVRRVIEGYKFQGTNREELLREPLNWTKFQKADALVEKAESVEKFEGNRFDKVTKSFVDGALVVTGEKKVTEKTEGLGGSFTFITLGPEMTLDKLLADGLPAFDSLAKYVFFTATGRTLSDVAKQKVNTFGFIGETDIYRVHLHYHPDKNWLRSNDAAFTEKLADEMLAANKVKKKLLVFAAAKFMSQRELSRQGVEFCQLPYAIHRILGD